MQAARIGTAWLAAMTLALSFFPGVSPARGQETSPAEVLKARGLKRSGTAWIVGEEAVVRKGVQQLRGPRRTCGPPRSSSGPSRRATRIPRP